MTSKAVRQYIEGLCKLSFFTVYGCFPGLQVKHVPVSYTHLVHSRRTSGRFITEDAPMLKNLRDELASRHIQDFMEKMKQLGFQEKETLEKLQDTIKRGTLI